MLVYLAGDPLPYAPHNLEQARNGLGVLVLLIIAFALFSSSNGNKAQAKPQIRRKAGNVTGIALVVGALVLMGKSHGNTDDVPTPAPKPTNGVTAPGRNPYPDPGCTHCSLICFLPND